MESGVRNCYEVTLRVRDVLRLMTLRPSKRTFMVEVCTDHDPKDYRNKQEVTVLLGGRVVRRNSVEYVHIPDSVGGVKAK